MAAVNRAQPSPCRAAENLRKPANPPPVRARHGHGHGHGDADNQGTYDGVYRRLSYVCVDLRAQLGMSLARRATLTPPRALPVLPTNALFIMHLLKASHTPDARAVQWRRISTLGYV